jgi:hypothetical protein
MTTLDQISLVFVGVCAVGIAYLVLVEPVRQWLLETRRNTRNIETLTAARRCLMCSFATVHESAYGVRREKAALSSGCKSHPATAPAESNRSSYGGNEVAEAFG